MKKYKPSITKNNELKNEFCDKAKAVIYKISKNKINQNLDLDILKPIVNNLEDLINKLSDSIGTGEEDVYNLYDNSIKALDELNKSFNQSLMTVIEEESDNLSYYVSSWIDLLDGKIIDLDNEKENKASYSRRKLLSRLDELKSIKEQFLINEQRLEKDIDSLEQRQKEYDELIIKEENERKINDLYRDITSLKSKLDSLNVRKSNYSACFNLLDIIYANANEIVIASKYSNIDLAKAKALLNLSKLKLVISEPDKAISILSRMEKEINEINQKTNVMDNKIFGINNETTIINQDALAYKESLLKKKHDKESLENVLNSDVNILNNKEELKEDK